MTLFTCPHCLARHDIAARPRDGDHSICGKCGHWSIFDAAAPSGLRPPTSAELHEMIENPAVRAVELAWCHANRIHSTRSGP